MMDAAGFYDWLVSEEGGAPGDGFDTHVAASILAIALSETGQEGCPVTETTGLDGQQLETLVSTLFPHALPVVRHLAVGARLCRSDDELCLVDLLQRCRSTTGILNGNLAGMIARRAQRPNHLWQDLGLRNRRELSWLMERHFRGLAARNDHDMKWKKFLYRTICRDAQYSLCTAPTCDECDDFETCFGEESGESLLARIRRNEAVI